MRLTKVIFAAAALASAAPAMVAVSVPVTAQAQVRVQVGSAGGYYWHGQHYHRRYWRNGAWVYDGPIGGPVVVAGGPGYMWQGRHWAHRGWVCGRAGRNCHYRYW
jgi:hypothetical protein